MSVIEKSDVETDTKRENIGENANFMLCLISHLRFSFINKKKQIMDLNSLPCLESVLFF